MSDDKAPEKPSDDKQLIEELLFKQDLNEVHLLIDFVSGRADRSLTALTMPNPSKPTETMTSGEIIGSISRMRYPPPEETPVINAQNAAILLMAKDRLSALAAPARGLTIAYTTMFIEAEAAGLIWSRLRRWSGNGARRKRETESGVSPAPAPTGDTDTATAAASAERLPDNQYRDHDTRVDLAQRTFPGLMAHARKFRRWRDGLVWFAVFWLFLTALAYWDAGLGRAALERLDQDWKTTMSELKDDPDLIHCKNGIDGEPAKPDEQASTGADAKASDDATKKEFACRKYNYLKWMGETAGTEVRSVFRCEEMRFSKVWHVWCWHWLLSGSTVVPGLDPDCPTAGQPGNQNSGSPAAAAAGESTSLQTGAERSPERVSCYAKANATYWQTATSMLAVFTTYVLPIMFALLGTLIGAFRAILNRIGASELAPRDLVRMQIGIPTGLVAGIAVGLFLSPSSVPIQGAGGVASQITLTASALGFLAGYASYSFFGFLDNMIHTVFPDGSATATPGQAARPGAENRG
jgi:hypothetical protein